VKHTRIYLSNKEVKEVGVEEEEKIAFDF